MELVTPALGLLFWQISGLVYLGLWVWVLYGCLRRDFENPFHKLIWVLVILFAPVVGPIFYLVLGRRNRERKAFNPYFKPTTRS